MRLVSLERRIMALEGSFQPVDQRTDWERHQQEREASYRQYRARRAELARELSSTMAPEHVHLVNQVWSEPCWGEGHERDGARHLAVVVETLLLIADADWHDGRLALPPAVGEVLLANPGCWLGAQCVDCKLCMPRRAKLPTDPYWAAASGPFFFTTCPDCGGEVVERAAQRRAREANDQGDQRGALAAGEHT